MEDEIKIESGIEFHQCTDKLEWNGKINIAPKQDNLIQKLNKNRED